MSNIIAEVNCTTGEVIHREMTAQEIAVRVENAKKAEEDRLAKEAQEAAQAKLKADVLKRLGITEQEAKALLS